MQDTDLIYKIASDAVAAESRRRGIFVGMPADHADGFVHFSTAGQLAETLRLHFRDRQDLHLLAVGARSLGDDLRWEPSRGGALFPHLYGTLQMSSVVREAPIAVDDQGRCTLPEWVK